MSGFGGFGQQQNTSGFGGFGTLQTPAPNNSGFATPAPSGFGQAPVAATGFGNASNAQPSFGASNTQSFGFNTQPMNNTAAPSSFGSSGFGTPAPSTGFGSTPAPNMGFGSSPASGIFGNTPAPSTFGAASSVAPNTSFGSSSAISNSMAFGNSSNNMGFGATPINSRFSTSPSTGTFGNAPASTTFGAPAASTGFGGALPSTNVGFGGSASEKNVAQSAPLTFGSSSTVAFGSSSSAAVPALGFSSFIQSSNEPASSGFGQASNATTSNQAGFGFGSSGGNKPAFGFGSSQPQNKSTPFGKPAQSMSQNDDNMGDINDVSSSPFGQRIPRKERKPDLTKPSMIAPLSSSRNDEGGDEHLAALRAKIQEKKNRLIKMKQGTQNNEVNNTSNNNDNNEDKVSTDSEPKTSLSNSELAAKNALRFASKDQSQTTSRLLPTDLQDRAGQEAQSSSSDTYEGGSSAQEEDDHMDQLRTLSGARDLVGVCRSMCPDEELLRREREGDIQLLEITDPGGLHPQNWTLRDTAVKRFRRSAADFKLDIPELVRPPEVLERVCGYLEEWVMERDRQGPDKRFSQQPSIVPPPLDVYQFIWDRTRMIRKDFILQNYIGDGGKCDARAVRCHERIARWHAMCEHQLSHIQEFVTHQSQQNIAELGQTMKTLNLYYDDALGRSLNEDPVDSAQQHCQGCSSDIVMGKCPIDFDGRDLSNSSSSDDVSNRIIGANGIRSSTRGTAEPEMRGLYILLTMNNEGGMEVIKYSGRLCTERSDIFYSKPVQLALSIFQARKDHNYAKFFHLLRSPTTPYLFSCIMFKYVEQMRKTALTIMSKTYGAKHKTTGESFYDEYPLENLVELLCFEDEEEARVACAHYGITLEGNIIRWRNSKFAEPKDPVKNITLTLKPKKMIRTIECKLNGATRLSVCRGGVSGEGATLGTSTSGQPVAASSEFSSQNAEQAKAKAAEQAKKDAIEKARQQNLLEKLKHEEARRKEEAAKEEARRKAEAAMKEAERKKMEEAKQLELERQRQALEEEKRLQRQRQEELRIKKEREEAIRRAEEDKRERERLQQLEKKRKEEELKQKLADEARRKAEAEEYARQQAELERQRRIAYEQEQKRLAEEERKRREAKEEEKKWVAKLESSQMLMVWKLWMNKMHKQCRANPVITLDSIDPTITSCSRLTSLSLPSIVNHSTIGSNNVAPKRWENELYQLATACRETCNLSQVIAQKYWRSSAFSMVSAFPISLMKTTILFKLSVVLPQQTEEIGNILTSLRAWADSHLQFHRVSQCTSHDRFRSHSVKVQAVATIGNDDANLCSDCDAALFLIPSVQSVTSVVFSNEILSSLPENTPRLVLLVGDTDKSINYPKDLIDIVLGPEPGSSVSCIPRNGVIVPTKDLLDDSFRNCCDALIARSLEESMQQPIVRVSLSKLSFLCIQNMLVNLSSNGSLRQYASTDSAIHGLYDYSMIALSTMVQDVTNLFEEIKSNSTHVWPANEFVSRRSKSVENYFDDGSHLPCDWYHSLQDTALIEDRVYGCFQYLFTPDSIVAFVVSTAQRISDRKIQQRLWNMLDDSNVVGYFAEVVSLIVRGEVNPDYQDMPTIYIPAEKMLDIIASAGHFNPPARAKPSELAEIPAYLYEDPPAETENASSKVDTSSELVVIKATKDNSDITPPAAHKRKPADEIMTTCDKKRIRMAQPHKIESDEVQSSKDFTSYLEALLG